MMNRIKTVLVIAQRSGEVAEALQKACIVARHFGATIELFACDAEHAYMAEHSYDQCGVSDAVAQCLLDSRRFLDAVRGSVVANDLEIRTSVACETPLHTGILRKIDELQPDLVIRCIERRGQQRQSALTPTDWQLLRSCPAPLMLTRGRTWNPVARIVAAVDLQPDEAALARCVLGAASYLASGCAGSLDVVHCQDGTTADDAARERMRALLLGADLAPLAGRLLAGAPEQTLPQLVRDGNVDVMVLGALSRRIGAHGDTVGTLTEALIESLDCDFLLVRDSAHAAVGVAERALSRGIEARLPA
jgi:universal stress protein E